MTVRAEASGPVAEVVLERPEQRNALTPVMLGAVALHIGSPPAGSRAILLRGEGRVFCAGFDLGLCVEDERALGRLLEGLHEVIAAMRASELPVVIAAHGAAVAGACALLAGADVVVADAGARLGYPVVRLGISPAVSAPTLAGAVGAGRARERLLDPGLIDGAAGHRLGLVHELVAAREDVLGRAREIALGLAGKPAVGMGATKRWLAEIERRLAPGATDREALEASLGRVGSAEERALLGEAWRSMGGDKR